MSKNLRQHYGLRARSAPIFAWIVRVPSLHVRPSAGLRLSCRPPRLCESPGVPGTASLAARSSHTGPTAVERQFHALIRERAGSLIAEHRVELPSLAGLRPNRNKPCLVDCSGDVWRLQVLVGRARPSARPIAEGWCRVVAGSGQRHEITHGGTWRS